MLADKALEEGAKLADVSPKSLYDELYRRNLSGAAHALLRSEAQAGYAYEQFITGRMDPDYERLATTADGDTITINGVTFEATHGYAAPVVFPPPRHGKTARYKPPPRRLDGRRAR